MRIMDYVLALFFSISSTIYIWHKLLDKSIDFKNKKLYITLFSLMILARINYITINAYVRITVITLLLMLFFSFLFKEKLKKCIITPLLSQMIVMISEMIFAIIITSVFNIESEEIVNTLFGGMISNFFIAFFSILIIQLKYIRKFYNFLINITDKVSKNLLITFSFIVIVFANILTMFLYYRVEFTYLLLFNTVLTLVCFFIVIYSLKTKNNYVKVYDKYNTTINSLKEYEKILDKYRISNHENKNQLLTIRNMLPKTNKKTIAYIDTVVENRLKDDDKIMRETSVIPMGGLRGLIYSKLLLMKQFNIDYILNISKELTTVDFITLDDSLMLDICQIVGVYIDNAIQAVENLKTKNVNIEIYYELEKLVIAISNNYEGILEMDKLEDIGYSSKGKNHGYGLSLTKQIIASNNKLENEKKISKNIFTQVLKISK